MSKNRYAANVDKNQKIVVEFLRSLPGVTVETSHDDFLIGYRGSTYWIELKSENAVSKKTGKVLESRKKDTQKRLQETWTGHYLITSELKEILQTIEYRCSDFNTILEAYNDFKSKKEK